MGQLLRRDKLVSFFLLVFLISWGLWIPMALNTLGLIDMPILPMLSQSMQAYVPIVIGQSIGAYAPFLAVMLLNKLTKERPSVKDVLRTIRFKSAWLIPAAFTAPLIVIAANIIYNLSGTPIPFIKSEITQELGWMLVIIFPIQYVSAFFGSPFGEEVGWRGFALPLLQRRFMPFIASLLLGFIWGIWHFPLLVSMGITPSIAFVLGIMGHSLIIDKLFTASGYNIFVAMIYHQSVNTAITFLGGGVETPLAIGLTWLVALVYPVRLEAPVERRVATH